MSKAQQHVALDRLSVRYGAKTALDDVSLGVSAGDVYALLGRNGAGKSTAVRCLLGQYRPDQGSARLLGHDSWRERATLMADVGVVPEEPDAPPTMTAAALERFCARFHRRWDATRFDQRLRKFEVPTNVAFGSLSKGQKNQVMLALALAHSPRILILDDPTLGLDVVARRGFFEELVVDLADRETTVFLTTHDLAGVESIATHVGILAGARLVIDEDLEQLKSRFRQLTFPNGTVAKAALAELSPLSFTEAEWGGHAVIERFTDDAWSRVADQPGFARALVEAMPLESIFSAVVATGRESA